MNGFGNMLALLTPFTKLIDDRHIAVLNLRWNSAASHVLAHLESGSMSRSSIFQHKLSSFLVVDRATQV